MQQNAVLKPPTSSRDSVPASVHTRLDPLETPDLPVRRSPSPVCHDVESTINHTFRHSHWKANRIRVARALEAANRPVRQQFAFARCGSSMWLLRHREHKNRFKAVLDTCRNRWCQPCQKERGRVITANLMTQIDDSPVRFLTLTLRSHHESLETLLARLYKAFKAIRLAPIWKDRIVGGCAFLEIKRAKNNTHWHPHFHILIQGRFVPKIPLAAAWLVATGDSHVIDIREVKTRREVFRYVVKYSTKTTSPTLHHDRVHLKEAIQTLQSRRTIIPFGSWRKMKLLRPPKNEDWAFYGHEYNLAAQAWSGDSVARAILAVLATLKPEQGLEFDIPP